MNRIAESKRRPSMIWMALVITAAVLFVLAQSSTATAQNTFPSSGNVGVGTTTPAQPLHVSGSDATGAGVLMEVENTATSGQAAAGILFKVGGVSKGSFGGNAFSNSGYGVVPGLGISAGTATDSIYFRTGSSINGTATGPQMLINSAGNVGIGTTTPGDKLTVYGSNIKSIFGDSNTHTNLYSTYNTQSWNAMEIYTNGGVGAHLVFTNNVTSGAIGGTTFANKAAGTEGVSDLRLGGFFSYTDGAANSGYLNFWTSSAGTFAERMRITSTGNVGIGTNSPGGLLSVVKAKAGGEVGIHINNTDDTGYSVLRFGVDTANAQSRGGAIHYINPSFAGSSGAIAPGVFNIQTNDAPGLSLAAANAAGPIMFYTGGNAVANERMRINGGGNIGIGTASPAYKLDVAGQIRSSSGGFIFPDGTVQTTAAAAAGGSGQWANDGNSTSTYYNSGNVGIGTASPARRLEVQVPSGTDQIARFSKVQTTNDSGGYIELFGGATASTVRGYIGFTKTGTGAATLQGNEVADYLSIAAPVGKGIHLGTTGQNNPIMTLVDGGNVGIGTNAPSTRLHVVGDVTVTGNIAAKYQDVAEWVEAAHVLPAGTVVTLNPQKSNQVMASLQAYDTRVAGVVSAQPGIALGESGVDKVLVATTGRVKVKVDARRSPIHVGDLLVTSNQEGLAMKSEPLNLGGTQIHRPGTLIGKALEPLEKGTGEILVLLSLQ